MEILKITKKIREYCDYIDTHICNVRKAWDGMQEPCKSMRFIYDDYVHESIEQLIVVHDMSKVSSEEFIQYQQRFFPVGEASKDGFSKAWDHHKANNPHHWENWAKATYSNPYEDECHCVCMVVDWTAMAYEFGGSAEQYYADNRKKIDLPEWAVEFIFEIFSKTRGSSLPCGNSLGSLR